MADSAVERARAALSRGDVLIAYDEALTAVEENDDDLDAHFVAALALARAGASDRARIAAADLLTRIDAVAGVSITLHEDAEALVARLAKDEALAATGDERRTRLQRAAELYERVADRYGRYFPCINAATLSLLAGDTGHAHVLAQRALDLVDADRAADPRDDYWREATATEAELVLGYIDAARGAAARAAAIAGDDFAALAVTRRQLRLVCEAIGADDAVLAELAPPLLLHYCGHRLDDDDRERFPASVENVVAQQIREFLATRRVGFGHGSLASGADILIAEALLEHGAQLHVILPFAADDFDRVSVAPAGPGWSDRFRTCLARASSVVLASDSTYQGNDELFGYAARIAMGHALNRAAFLGAPAEQLAVWDQGEGPSVAGTAHDVEVWAKTGNPTHVISLPAGDRRPTTRVSDNPTSEREIGAILFTDFRGFSRLRDEHFPVFVTQVFAALGAVLDAHEDDVRWSNSWGDAIAAVFADVAAAADCALGLHETLSAFDLAAIGLPIDLDLRIGAHAGPVMAFADPIGHRRTYWGRELTRAARIEPRTPEGEVYVTDAYAALLALDPHAPFAVEYVGRITTAKDFETIPMYRLRRKRPM